MRKTLTILALALGVLLATAAMPATADPGHERPRITRFEFRSSLQAGRDERLIVVAHDPDSWISEIQVRWEDRGGNGGVIFAHTYCVQDPTFEDPGTPARLKLDVWFAHAGRYHVEARAISERRCESGNETRTSRTLEMDVSVAGARTRTGTATGHPGPDFTKP